MKHNLYVTSVLLVIGLLCGCASTNQPTDSTGNSSYTDKITSDSTNSVINSNNNATIPNTSKLKFDDAIINIKIACSASSTSRLGLKFFNSSSKLITVITSVINIKTPLYYSLSHYNIVVLIIKLFLTQKLLLFDTGAARSCSDLVR